MNRNLLFVVRKCLETDVEEIAKAHIDSIQSISSNLYSPELIADWIAVTPINGQRYIDAINQGAVIHVAEGKNGEILGLSEVHHVEDRQYNAAVFLCGKATRKEVGTALYQAAETIAVRSGAHSIELNASLAAVEFYKAQGFEEYEQVEIATSPGKFLQGMRMRKNLSCDKDG